MTTLSLQEKNKMYRKWVQKQKDKKFITIAQKVSSENLLGSMSSTDDLEDKLSDPSPSKEVLDLYSYVVLSLEKK